MIPEDIVFMLKQARKELDNNKDIVCSLTEIFIVFMPIIPSSFWNRLWITCLYILLYSVNAQDKYYEMKNKYLMAPCYEYNSLSDDNSHVDIRNDLSMKISASEADASEIEEDNDSDSDYEDNNETKKNK